MSNQNHILDICGCCEGIKTLTPVSVENLPGLAALVYRVGTHASFKKSMQTILSTKPTLEQLTTRDDDDPSIALLDAWATVLDVLTFYQERIINEGYLRTARERRSVLELARHISYNLRPGVAAGTYLAFTMDETPGAPSKAAISIGSRVQSVPGQDELPQVFETVEDIEALVERNALKPRTSEPKLPASDHSEVYLKGTSTNLIAGDVLLFIGNERIENPNSHKWALRKVKKVDLVPSSEPGAVPNAGYTKVILDTALGSETPEENPKIYAMRQKAALFGNNAPDWRVISDDIKIDFKKQFPLSGLYARYCNNINFTGSKVIRIDSQVDFNWVEKRPHSDIGSEKFSVRWTGLVKPPQAGYFTFYTRSDDGVRLWVDNELIIENWTDHKAKLDSGIIWLEAGRMYDIRLDYYEKGKFAVIQLYWRRPGTNVKEIIPQGRLYHPRDYSDWPGFDIASISGVPVGQEIDTIYLDNLYPKIVKESWLVLVTSKPGNYVEVYEVLETRESSCKNFTLASKTTAVKLEGEYLRAKFNNSIRETVVYAQSEELEIAETPIATPISGKEIVLNSVVSGLKEGHKLIITGKRIRASITNTVPLVSMDKPALTKQLNPGNELIVMESPIEIEVHPYGKKWHLKDNLEIDGKNTEFEGHVTVSSSEITYTSAREDDETVSELIELSSLEAEDDNHTKLVLDESLKNIYDRATVTISANIARATHGETKTEVLGSGDGSQTFQKFELKQKPLTYVSAATASGTETTLEIRVNDILWKEVPTLYEVSPEERVYITRIADDGKVTVQFGDGITGARLPTGTENVKATYRVGIGFDGLLDAGQLSLLMTPQLGVKEVINQLAPTGADDPEKRDMARQNAPLTVLTMDRIVSIQDFEDFTRAFTGIGKARADLLWKGEQRVVHITVASADGKGVDTASDLYKNLTFAIDAARHSNYQVQVSSFKSLDFDVKARVLVDDDYIEEDVLQAVSKALQEVYSFNARDFGQVVTPSEVTAIIQGVKGVIAVDLEELGGWDGKNIVAAELLTINRNGIEITVMPS
ncbi:MAG: putative baseplate assembly protein [candidate division Zixibacteria bacterium]